MFRWSRFLSAYGCVLVTTIDDSIWLVSFVAGQQQQHAWIHAIVFGVTLLGLSIVCCGVSYGVEQAFFARATNVVLENELELRLELLAAILCWLLAIGLYVKKRVKQARRRRERLQNSHLNDEREQQSTESSALLREPREHDEETTNVSPQIWTVASLTTLGFLDEFSYFPTLLLAHIVSYSEFITATLLAAVTMLALQAFLATQCRPVVEWIDKRTTLWGIVVVFAIVLTLHYAWDLCSSGIDCW